MVQVHGMIGSNGESIELFEGAGNLQLIESGGTEGPSYERW